MVSLAAPNLLIAERYWKAFNDFVIKDRFIMDKCDFAMFYVKQITLRKKVS